MNLSYSQIAVRLVLATLVGLSLGYERSKHGKPVGGRTHAIICMSSAIIAMIGAYGFDNDDFTRDPTRLAVGVLQGIGFIGAGVIWRNVEGPVKGLTTAANVFATACFGLAIGFGYYFMALLATAITLAVLVSSLLVGSHREKKKRQDKETLSQEKKPLSKETAE